MTMTKDEQIKARLISDVEFLNRRGLEVAGIFLQGSQNYHLDDEESDIDTKAIIIPSLDDLIFDRAPVSETYVINEKNEHIEAKDIREMCKMFRKQNPSYLELLFTPYYISYVPEIDTLREHAEEIARYDISLGLNAMRGMVMEKYFALTKERPSTAARIQKYGYDPKQLHHMFRLEEMITGLIENKPYAQLISGLKDPAFLTSVKRGYYPEQNAIWLAKDCVDNVNKMVNEYKKTHGQGVKLRKVNDLLDSTCFNIIYNSIKDSFI